VDWGATNNIQIANNTFDNNVVGVFLDASSAPISATVQGNTFVVPIGSPDTDVGLLATGSGVTATIGGDGSLANTMENYANGAFIIESHGSSNGSWATPKITIYSSTQELPSPFPGNPDA